MQKKSTSQENTTPRITPTQGWRVKAVTLKENYAFDVEFNDGTMGTVDMSTLIFSDTAGVFSSLRDQSLFQKISIQHGAVTWPGDIDLAPDEMHTQIQKNGFWCID